MSNKLSFTDISISQRIKKLRKTIGLSQAKFAESLGIKQPTLSEIEKGVYPPSDSAIRLLVSQYRVNREWLETGSGEVFQVAAEKVKNEADARPSIPDGYVQIPYYEVKTSSDGTLLKSDLLGDFLLFKKDWIRNVLKANAENLGLITVMGDSMEPTLFAGDIVMVDLNSKVLGINGIYVLIVRGMLQVSRIQRRIQSDAVVIMPDNSLYDSETLSTGQAELLKVVGRVIWYGRRG